MDRNTGAPLAGADHLAQSIGDILSTPLGHRIARREYGSDLPELLDQPMNARTVILVYAATAQAITRQEARVSLRRVAIERDTTTGAFILRLTGLRTDAPAGATPLDLSISVRALGALS